MWQQILLQCKKKKKKKKKYKNSGMLVVGLKYVYLLTKVSFVYS